MAADGFVGVQGDFLNSFERRAGTADGDDFSVFAEADQVKLSARKTFLRGVFE